MYLNEDELYDIYGGAFSSSLGMFVIDVFNYIVDLGRYFGSSIAHLLRRTKC